MYRKCATMRAGPTNCCGMVGRALQFGGLDVYAASPTNLFYQGTATLMHSVDKAVARINELNQQIQPLPETGWMNYLTLIHHQCYDHLASKPTSDRRAALLAWVKVIYSALAGHKVFMEVVSVGTLGIQPSPPAFFSAWIGERFA